MKYKLINLKTKEETICEKVVVDGSDYYLSKEVIKVGDINVPSDFSKTADLSVTSDLDLSIVNEKSNGYKKVIATSNPNSKIPKVIDLIERDYVDELDKRRKIAKEFTGQVAGKHPYAYTNLEVNSMIEGYLDGYNKSQETHPFTEEDMIEFAEWKEYNFYQHINDMLYKTMQARPMYKVLENKSYTLKELLKLWKEQRIKPIYYE